MPTFNQADIHLQQDLVNVAAVIYESLPKAIDNNILIYNDYIYENSSKATAAYTLNQFRSRTDTNWDKDFKGLWKEECREHMPEKMAEKVLVWCAMEF